MKTQREIITRYFIAVALGILIGVLCTSCKKEPITPGNYQTTTPEPAPTQTLTNVGTTPTWTVPVTNNTLVGTNWVLTDVYYNYAHVSKSDTIHFINNTKYTVGSDTTKWLYSLTSTMGNGSISLYQFNPINGLYLSASNFNPSAFNTTPIGGTIQLNLKDNFTSTNNTYTSTFKKI